MFRRTPIETLDVIGYLGINPEKQPGVFIESKQQHKYLRKPPNTDTVCDSIELLAFENERELQILRNTQKELLQEVENKREINRDRVKQIFKLQTHLRRRFAEVNMNMKECDDKKIRAEQRVAEEKAKHKELKNTIEKYKNDLEILTQFRNDLSKTVKDLEPYETGINDVVMQSDAFTSVKDCTDRCDALMLVQTEINEMKRVKLLEIETKRQEMVRMSKEASLTVLGFLNELAKLERDLFTASHECQKWEKLLAEAKNCIAENILTKNRMMDGIRLLHRELCMRRNITPLTVPIEKQLDFIRSEILILQQVVLEYNQSKA